MGGGDTVLPRRGVKTVTNGGREHKGQGSGVLKSQPAHVTNSKFKPSSANAYENVVPQGSLFHQG